MVASVAKAVSGRVASFLHWWGQELAACVPRSLPGRLGVGRPKMWVLVGRDSVAFRDAGGSGLGNGTSIDLAADTPERLAARVRAVLREARIGSMPVGLLLAPDAVLRPTVTLPAAAEENLGEVLAFEMDRHTPLRADDVYYDYRLLAADRSTGQLSVELAVVRRSEVDRGLALLSAWGVAVDRVAVEDARMLDGVAFNLLPEAAVPSRSGGLRRLLIGEAVVVCLLAAAALYLPIGQKRDALAATEARLSALQGEAAAVTRLREEVSDISARFASLAGRKMSRPAAIAVLGEVTRVLPDDTWLTELSWHENGIDLVGYSRQPSSLIALLEGSALFAEARFDAPVTTDAQLGVERFNIVLTLEAGETPQ